MDEARKGIHSLATLTYQQRQLLDAGELLPVFYQVRRRRRLNSAFGGTIMLLCSWLTIRSALAGSFDWVSTFVTIFAGWIIGSRFRKERQVEISIRHFLNTPEQSPRGSVSGNDAAPACRLETELRLNEPLTFEHLQLLKQGKVSDVARLISGTHSRNGTTTLTAMATLFGAKFLGQTVLFVRLDPQEETRSVFVLDLFVQMLFITALLALAIREFRISHRLLKAADEIDRT